MTLSGAKFFTTMDLSKAYYQVPLTERAKKTSAFTTPFGLFEFERLSFGFVNAPITFQWLIKRCFQDMNMAELIIFLDDVLVHAKSLVELEERTINVLARMSKYGLKLDPDKCMFGEKEVSFRFSPYSGRSPTRSIQNRSPDHMACTEDGEGRQIIHRLCWLLPEMGSTLFTACQTTQQSDRRVHPQGDPKEG